MTPTLKALLEDLVALSAYYNETLLSSSGCRKDDRHIMAARGGPFPASIMDLPCMQALSFPVAAVIGTVQLQRLAFDGEPSCKGGAPLSQFLLYTLTSDCSKCSTPDLCSQNITTDEFYHQYIKPFFQLARALPTNVKFSAYSMSPT